MEYKVTGLNELSKQFSDFQTRMGFTDSNVTQRLMLVHSEISECFEAFRKDRFAKHCFKNDSVIRDKQNAFSLTPEFGDEYWKTLFERYIKDSVEDEAADVIIRMLAFCAENEIDIENHIALKMKYNELRGFKYGGKKF